MNSSVKTLKTLAVETFLNEIQPILELIKNAYDANATKVEITLFEKEKYLKVKDNGDGLNLTTFNNELCILDKSSKKKYKTEYIKDLQEFRTKTGSKGNGIFSTLRLGYILKIHSKTKNGRRLDKEINWNDYLTKKIEPSLTKVNFIDCYQKYFLNNVEGHGTVIEIKILESQKFQYLKLFLEISRELKYVSLNKKIDVIVEYKPEFVKPIQLSIADIGQDKVLDERNYFTNVKNINDIFDTLIAKKLFLYLIEVNYDYENKQLSCNIKYNKRNKLTYLSQILAMEKPKVYQLSSNIIKNLDLLKTNVKLKFLTFRNDTNFQKEIENSNLDKFVFKTNTSKIGTSVLWEPYNLFYLNDIQMLLDKSQSEFKINLKDEGIIKNSNTFSYIALNFGEDMILDSDRSRVKLIDTDNDKESVKNVLYTFKTKVAKIITTELLSFIDQNKTSEEKSLGKIIKAAKKRKVTLNLAKWTEVTKKLIKVSEKIQTQNKYFNKLQSLIGEITLLIQKNNNDSFYTNFRIMIHSAIRIYAEYCCLYFFEEQQRFSKLKEEDLVPFLNSKNWTGESNFTFQLASMYELIASMKGTLKTQNRFFEDLKADKEYQSKSYQEFFGFIIKYCKSKKIKTKWTVNSVFICENFFELCKNEYQKNEVLNKKQKNDFLQNLVDDINLINKVMHGVNNKVLYEKELISIVNIFSELIFSLNYVSKLNFK